jgi:hypothetical protein
MKITAKPKLPPKRVSSYIVKLGIDAGTNTGVAVWYPTRKEFGMIETMPLHTAFELVQNFAKIVGTENVFVRFEDARKVKFKTREDRKQGAGYVKAHSQIWEAFLSELGVGYEGVRPNKAITKLPADTFQKITGWQKRTNEHGRDAAMLVFQS